MVPFDSEVCLMAGKRQTDRCAPWPAKVEVWSSVKDTLNRSVSYKGVTRGKLIPPLPFGIKSGLLRVFWSKYPLSEADTSQWIRFQVTGQSCCKVARLTSSKIPTLIHLIIRLPIFLDLTEVRLNNPCAYFLRSLWQPGLDLHLIGPISGKSSDSTQRSWVGCCLALSFKVIF